MATDTKLWTKNIIEPQKSNSKILTSHEIPPHIACKLHDSNKIDSFFEDESPLYLTKKFSNIDLTKFEQKIQKNIQTNQKTEKSFVIQTLGSQKLFSDDVDKIVSSGETKSAQNFVNNLVKEKICNSKLKYSSISGHYQTICLKLNLNTKSIILQTNSENIKPLELDTIEFKNIKIWSLADFDTRFLVLIVDNDLLENQESPTCLAHYFHYDVSAINIVASINDMLNSIKADNFRDFSEISRETCKKVLPSRSTRTEKYIKRQMRTRKIENRNSNSESDYSDKSTKSPKEPINNEPEHEFQNSKKSPKNDQIFQETEFQNSTPQNRSRNVSSNLQNMLKQQSSILSSINSSSTWSIVSSCLSEYMTSHNNQEILNEFSDGLTHYLGYANLVERFRNSEQALTLIEKFVQKSEKRNETYFDLMEKPTIKVIISANSLIFSRIFLENINSNSVTNLLQTPPAKTIRTRYLAWIILSKNPKFLGIIEHADKFRIHLIFHEENAKNIADCIQQACLIRYQKMVDGKIG